MVQQKISAAEDWCVVIIVIIFLQISKKKKKKQYIFTINSTRIISI
jgi:hypothetical protein